VAGEQAPLVGAQGADEVADLGTDDVARDMDLVRAALGEERYAQALEAGRALVLTQAVEEAIARIGEVAQPRIVDSTS